MNPIIVLGSGLAGYAIVRELRKLNRDTPITLVTRDNGDSYSKPMLSNAFAQKKDPLSLVISSATEIAQQLGITLLANTEVLAVHRDRRKLDTTVGTLAYDKLVLALGADPVQIPVQGDARQDILSVNDLADYSRLRNALGNAKSIAIMGGGLIGCEFANDLAAADYAVTVIDRGAYPLGSLVPQQAGSLLLEPLALLGVTWHFGTTVQCVDKATKGYLLTLADDSTVQADLVISAVGLRPRIQLARECGLTVNRGIAVNEHLCSSDRSIFALGDCAEIAGKVQPFVLPIMHAARTLARVLNGEMAKVEFPAMPVVVKTPAHPVVVSPVAKDAVGAWQVLATGKGIKLGFFDGLNELRGFVLTGDFAGERNEMSKQLAV